MLIKGKKVKRKRKKLEGWYIMQNNVNHVSVELITPNVYQPRKYFNEEAIEELSQSIKTYGIIQPLTVRKSGENRYELVAGERRLRGCARVARSPQARRCAPSRPRCHRGRAGTSAGC